MRWSRKSNKKLSDGGAAPCMPRAPRRRTDTGMAVETTAQRHWAATEVAMDASDRRRDCRDPNNGWLSGATEAEEHKLGHENGRPVP